jgi:hypothetical protein
VALLVDDQSLAALLREAEPWPDDDVFTSGCWYLRLCQAVVRGAGGTLSRPILALPPGRRDRAWRAVLELPDRVGVVGWKTVAPSWPNSSTARDAG